MAFSHYWDGKYVIHSEADTEMDMSFLKTAKKINKLIENEFKQRGINELYTWAETEEQKRYNEFLGFEPTGETVNDSFVDKEYPRPVYEYRKELS